MKRYDQIGTASRRLRELAIWKPRTARFLCHLIADLHKDFRPAAPRTRKAVSK